MAPKQESVKELDADLRRTAQLADGEEVLMGGNCDRRVFWGFWLGGRLYLTTERLFWYPVFLPTSWGRRIIAKRRVGDVVSVFDLSARPEKWIVKTDSETRQFALPVPLMSAYNRDKWIAAIKQGANVSGGCE